VGGWVITSPGTTPSPPCATASDAGIAAIASNANAAIFIVAHPRFFLQPTIHGSGDFDVNQAKPGEDAPQDQSPGRNDCCQRMSRDDRPSASV